MLGCYIDVHALRRVLWSILMAAGALSSLSECSSSGSPQPPAPRLVGFGIAVITLEACLRAFFPTSPPAYVVVRLSMPPLQLPPVARSAAKFNWMPILASSAFVLSFMMCTPWPAVGMAILAGAPSVLLLTPLFGCTLFWRLHYLVFRDATARFEEWFCAAEHTAAIALAVAPTPPAPADEEVAVRILVVGSGLSELPLLMATRGRSLVTAVDAAPAAVAAMRARCEAEGAHDSIDWLIGDATSTEGLGGADRYDVIVDKGTYAALLEQSHHAYADGFEAARQALRDGGALVTVALVPLTSRQLAAAGFELGQSYRVPAVGQPCGCIAPSYVYAQVCYKVAAIETASGRPPACRMPRLNGDDAIEQSRLSFVDELPPLVDPPMEAAGPALTSEQALLQRA